MRERIWSSASSTLSTVVTLLHAGAATSRGWQCFRAVRAPAPPAPSNPGRGSTGADDGPSDAPEARVWQGDDGLELAEEPAPAPHEEGDESGRDREVAGAGHEL